MARIGKRTILVLIGCLSLTVTTFLLVTAQSERQSQQSVVRTSSPRSFELEVLVDGRPLPQYFARGRSYIEALEGAEYELRIRNPYPERMAVALAVDGLNTIDARHTSAWNASKWVIEPYGTITISGWQMSSERARRFYFTSERDSYGAKLGQTANLGVITAVVYRERRRDPIQVVPPEQSRNEDKPTPRDPGGSARSESRAKANTQAASVANDDYAATGIGRSVTNDVTWVQMELDQRPVADMAIRYEYYSALLRLGIIPRNYGEPSPLKRRENSRGFSPEPEK